MIWTGQVIFMHYREMMVRAGVLLLLLMQQLLRAREAYYCTTKKNMDRVGLQKKTDLDE